MPIGTPSVPYRLPGSQYERWVDIYTRLGVERTGLTKNIQNISQSLSGTHTRASSPPASGCVTTGTTTTTASSY